RGDDDVRDRAVVAAGGGGADLVDDGAARGVRDAAEDRVVALQPGGGGGGDEELRAVGAAPRDLPGVRHGEHVGLGEVQLGVDLVVEGVAGAPRAGTDGVPALDHEVGADPVDEDAVVQRLVHLLPGTRVGPRPL